MTLREAEMRSTSPIPTWEIPIWKDISPRQRKVNEALALINKTLDELIDICKVNFFSYVLTLLFIFKKKSRLLDWLLLLLQRLVEEEDLQFHEEYMNEQDPSILHFLLASGDDVWCTCSLKYYRSPNILVLTLLQFVFIRSPASNSVMI